jgi:hypothetical protein
MIALIDMKTKKVIEIHNYSMDEFIKQKYGRFCSLKTKNGIIVGDVHPELIWVEWFDEKKLKEDGENDRNSTRK